MENILTKLKEATRPQHEGVENTVDVMSNLFTLDDYKTLVTKFYRFYSAIEPEMEKLDWGSVGIQYDERRNLPMLEKDLAHLGIDRESGIEKWDDLPKLSTLSEGFGSLYVIEGSTLGGQIIKRHLEQHLKLTPESGGLFFSGYGAKTGEMWKSFGSAITAFAESRNEDEIIIENAKATFDSINKCFQQSI